MIQVRRSEDRGRENHGWLDSRHTFSFADYYDPAHMGFHTLRVINEDRLTGGEGFPRHPHRDMEIISYVIEGALAHEDSLGNGSVMKPGEVQIMSAGTGVAHSEYNASPEDPLHFLQIWIVPERRGLAPGYAQKDFTEARRGKLALVASPDGRDGSVTVHQDVSLYAAVLEAGQTVAHTIASGRRAWVQVVRGVVRMRAGAGDESLAAGDGAALEDETSVQMYVDEAAELLLFDLG